jgi:hypothetical protein
LCFISNLAWCSIFENNCFVSRFDLPIPNSSLKTSEFIKDEDNCITCMAHQIYCWHAIFCMYFLMPWCTIPIWRYIQIKQKKNNVKSLSFKDYNKNVRILFIIQDLGDFKQLVWFKQKYLGVSWHTSVSAYRLPVSVITNLNFKYFMCRGFNYVKNFTLVVRETIEIIQIYIFVNLKTYQF